MSMRRGDSFRTLHVPQRRDVAFGNDNAGGEISIEAAIFDFGMVICSFDLQRLVHNLSAATGLPPSEISDTLVHLKGPAIQYESGLLTTDEFFLEVRQRTGLPLTKERLREAYCDIFSPIPSTFEVITRLKGRYKLALLSNTSEWHFEHGIRQAEIFPLFDTVTLSYQVGVMKPAEAIYRDALAKLDLPPDACVYIDDLKENVEAGARLGMRAIHYRSPEQLNDELHSLGMLPDS
jgi:epoxide hydrolase-like predicted phosphatase